nr:hypothetical protein [Tanacetum cinerariifolium]
MRRVGKGFSGVDTLLFDGMLVPQQVKDEVADVVENEDAANEISVEPTPPSPTPVATPPPQQELIPSPSQTLLWMIKRMYLNRGKIVELYANEDITLETDDVQGRLPESQAQVYHLDLEYANKVLSMQEINEAGPAKVEEVIEVVIAAKLMTEVVTTAVATTAAITTTAATTITAALVSKASALRRRRGVIIHDPKEAATAS